MFSPITVEVPEELRALLPTFLHNRQADVALLEAALAVGDLMTIQQTGHNLKGVGGGYGFIQITRLGERLEALCAVGDRLALADCIHDLRAFLAHVNVVFVSG